MWVDPSLSHSDRNETARRLEIGIPRAQLRAKPKAWLVARRLFRRDTSFMPPLLPPAGTVPDGVTPLAGPLRLGAPFCNGPKGACPQVSPGAMLKGIRQWGAGVSTTRCPFGPLYGGPVFDGWLPARRFGNFLAEGVLHGDGAELLAVLKIFSN